jgi:uncharacterized protein involved in copper resistance
MNSYQLRNAELIRKIAKKRITPVFKWEIYTVRDALVTIDLTSKVIPENFNFRTWAAYTFQGYADYKFRDGTMFWATIRRDFVDWEEKHWDAIGSEL